MGRETFSKQWGKRPNIRNIGGRQYHYQTSCYTKNEASEVVEYYREQGRLARSFKHVIPAHVLKGSLQFRGKEEIVKEHVAYDIYVTVKFRSKK